MRACTFHGKIFARAKFHADPDLQVRSRVRETSPCIFLRVEVFCWTAEGLQTIFSKILLSERLSRITRIRKHSKSHRT
jgi:hypothetical protein